MGAPAIVCRRPRGGRGYGARPEVLLVADDADPDSADPAVEAAVDSSRSLADRVSDGSVVFWRFWRAVEADMLLLRAAGMAYATLAALVPLLLLVVGVLDASGMLAENMDALEEVVFNSLLGSLPEVRDALMPGLRQADLHNLGIVGIIGLVFVAGRLVLLIEEAYGATFGVPGRRTIWARAALLFGGTFGAPILLSTLAAALYDGLGGFGVSNAQLTVGVFQWVVLVLALKMLPATRVRWGPAVLGASVSAVMLIACASGFQTYVAWFARGNPVVVFFGSLGLLPVFLLWLYLVWVSVLVGVEVAAMVQYRRSLTYAIADVEAEEAPPLDGALAVLGVLASARADGEMLLSDEELSARLRLPPRIVGALVSGWEDRRVVVRSADGDIVLAVGDDAPLARLARRWRMGSRGGSKALRAVRRELDARLAGTLGEAAQRWRRRGTFNSEMD